MRTTHSPPSSGSESTNRPHKRQRVNSHSTSPTCRQLVLEEVDLEIALRERLAATVQSRITWALLLQQAVQGDLNNVRTPSFGFREASLDALAAIEAPCDVLFTREVQPNPNLRPSITPALSISAPVDTLKAPATHFARNRISHRNVRPAPQKLLFLRNTSTYPPQIVKLVCPDCSRTDFSSLQGLLNHCRIRHKREFGSHDDCVQNCAVLVEDPEEQAFTAVNGIEVAGISLPGLRRLFELAVGGGLGLLPTPASTRPVSDSQVTPEETAPLPEEGPQTVAEPTEGATEHLTRTPRHHVDSPTLAPFLGRVPKTRHIQSHREEQHVDVLGFDNSASALPWRKPYAHRNNARSSLDQVVELSPSFEAATESRIEPVPDRPSSLEPVHAPKSRFKIAARVSVCDISLWIPPTRRLETFPEHTHHWRVAVSSPSYSLPISSFLKQVTVTCLTDSPPSSLVEPITIDRAPFIFSNTTDRPFLARLTFTWAGVEGQNPSLEVDHWVELDPVHLSTPVLGDEQFFDVELDRNTELFPAQADPRFDVCDFDKASETTSESRRKGDDTDSSALDPEYAVKLKTLLPQVPLTMKEVKAKLPRQLPYTLVSTPAQYRSLLYGRRKALEWRRARALLEAYDDLCSSQPESSHIPLTVVDVLHWLEDQGQFPRSSATAKLTEASQRGTARRSEIAGEIFEDTFGSDAYCRNCGLHYHYHPSSTPPDQHGASPFLDSGVKLEPTPTTIPSMAASSTCFSFCGNTTEIPPIDVTRLLVPSAGSANADMNCNDSEIRNNASHDLVTAAEPALTTAIRDLCAKWKLDKFPSSPSTPLAQTSQASCSTAISSGDLLRSRNVTEADMAPYALLSLVARSVAKGLIEGGLEEFRRDEAGIRALGTRNRVRKNVQVKRLLTPSHVVRGLVRAGSSQTTSESSLLAVFAPLGISLPAIPEADGTVPTPGEDG